MFSFCSVLSFLLLLVMCYFYPFLFMFLILSVVYFFIGSGRPTYATADMSDDLCANLFNIAK